MPFTPPVSLTLLSIPSPAITGDTLSIDSSVLPLVINADLNTSRIEVSIGSKVFALLNPTVVSGQNQFIGAIPINTSVATAVVQIIGRSYNPWQPQTQFAVGYRIVDSNGNVQVVTTAGVSGSTTPVWGLSGTTADGTVTWTFVGSYTNPNAVTTWAPNTTYAVGTVIIDSNGNAQQAIAGGTSGGTAPTWGTSIGSITHDPSIGLLQWITLGPPVTPIFKFNLIFFNTALALQIGPPSGLRAYKSQNSCKIEWVTPQFTGFIGVRVQLSSDLNGVNPPFSQTGDLVSAVSRLENTVINSNTTMVVNGNSNVTTTTSVTQQNQFSSVTIPSSAVDTDIFYAVVSTVIQDPNTNAVFESQQNGPLTCGFVNLRVISPNDFLPLERKENIAARMIAQITALYPTLDLSPRSEIRDLLIDPVSVELSNLSVREWFSRCSTSISAISQIDNASGNGISDTFTSSPVKQQIARAYGLNPTDTQALIDKQFDVLAEQAGLTRGQSTSSVVTLTFYTFVKPTTSVVFPVGAVVATQPDQQTPALNFSTTASASLDIGSVNSFFNPEFNWWQVNVPAQCVQTGTIGNVGAGTVKQIVSGVPQGWAVTNLAAAAFGTDTQSNASLAEQIQARIVTGVDTGTRNGYFVTALGTPGITQSIIVAGGDLYMLRDYDPVRVKHVGGAVDIYTRGTTINEQDTLIPFEYGVTSNYGQLANYVPLILTNVPLLKFQIPNFAAFINPFYTAVELAVVRGNNTFFLGTTLSTIDAIDGFLFLNANEEAFVVTNPGTVNQSTAPLLLNNVPATNLQALTALGAQQGGVVQFLLFARIQSPLSLVPTLQPILTISSVTGNQATGVVPSTAIRLVRTADFLLNGGSNQANDTVAVNSTTSALTTKNVVVVSSSVPLDTAIDLVYDLNGNVVLSKTVNGIIVPSITVRSSDLSTLFTYGVDYTLQPSARYHTYTLNIPAPTTVSNAPFSIPTVGPFTIQVLTSNASFVQDQGVSFVSPSSPLTKVPSSPAPGQYSVSTTGLYTFNIADLGKAIVISWQYGSAIVPGGINPPTVVVSYYKFTLAEQLTFVNQELDTLTSNIPTTLQQTGFVHNTWLPISYGNQTLVTDTGLINALVPFASRYIKVTFNNGATDIVMREGIDYTLTVDSVSGSATLTRILSGAIPSGATVKVSYFINETFTIATQYPAFVQILATKIAQSKHATANVLVKAMLANPIDLSMTVTLDPSASATTVDGNVRSAISIVLDNAKATLAQSVLVQAVQSVTGVLNVALPLLKCAKSDGAYDIGVVVPTQTAWTPLAQDPAFASIQTPANAFIAAQEVLPDATIPGGGLADAFVGMLLASGGAVNQPQAFRRASSVQDFLTNSGVPSFYIIGANDFINSVTPLAPTYAQRILVTIPSAVSTPSLQSYFVTYQVFGEGGAKDISISPTEFFVPGNITINYISSTQTQTSGSI